MYNQLKFLFEPIFFLLLSSAICPLCTVHSTGGWCHRMMSVRPFVCLSGVTLMYADHKSWATSNFINQPSISALWNLHFSYLVQWKHPQIWDRTERWCKEIWWFSTNKSPYLRNGEREPGCCSLIGSRIIPFNWYENNRPRMTLNGHYALCYANHASFGAHHENLKEIPSAAKCSPGILASSDIKLVRIFVWVGCKRR